MSVVAALVVTGAFGYWAQGRWALAQKAPSARPPASASEPSVVLAAAPVLALSASAALPAAEVAPALCPADMVLVEGKHCSDVAHHCRRWLDDEKLPPSAIHLAPKRLAKLKERATAFGLAKSLAPLEAKVKSLAAEAAAQDAFLAAADDDLELDAAEWTAFAKKHGKTRFARWIADHAKRD